MVVSIRTISWILIYFKNRYEYAYKCTRTSMWKKRITRFYFNHYIRHRNLMSMRDYKFSSISMESYVRLYVAVKASIKLTFRERIFWLSGNVNFNVPENNASILTLTKNDVSILKLPERHSNVSFDVPYNQHNLPKLNSNNIIFCVNEIFKHFLSFKHQNSV